MAKKKTTAVSKRKKNGFTIPLFVVAPLALQGLKMAGELQRGLGAEEVLDRFTYAYTGFSPRLMSWKWERLKIGLFPLLGGIVAHKVATKLGVNRALSSAGVPWIRM